MLARLLPRGRLDPDFGNQGVALGEPAPNQFVPFALDHRERAITVQNVENDVVVSRWTETGEPDAAFHDEGSVTTSLTRGCCDFPLDIVVQDDDAAGTGTPPHQVRIPVVLTPSA